MFFTMYPHYGNLNEVPLQQANHFLGLLKDLLGSKGGVPKAAGGTTPRLQESRTLRVQNAQIKGVSSVTILGFVIIWVAVKEFSFSYHRPETVLFTLHPYSGNLH